MKTIDNREPVLIDQELSSFDSSYQGIDALEILQVLQECSSNHIDINKIASKINRKLRHLGSSF